MGIAFVQDDNLSTDKGADSVMREKKLLCLY